MPYKSTLYRNATIEWDGHRYWFAASLTNPNRLLVMCEDDNTNEKVAIVRFDVENERALISINLAPKMRGKAMKQLEG